VPFGFDPLQAERVVKEIRDEKNKIYVDVIVRWMPDGKIIPLRFIWQDGSEYRIDRVINAVKGHCLKVFSPGMRYYCQTRRRRYYLHFDGEKWYVETQRILGD
jgi:hypothetical protein